MRNVNSGVVSLENEMEWREAGREVQKGTQLEAKFFIEREDGERVDRGALDRGGTSPNDPVRHPAELSCSVTRWYCGAISDAGCQAALQRPPG